MKNFITVFFVLLFSFALFGNEKSAESKFMGNAFSFNIEKNILNNEASELDNANLFAINNSVKYAAKSSASSRLHLGLGVGFLVPGIIMVFPLSAVLIPVGVVLMTTPNRSWINAYGYAESWVSQEQYNAGLGCTIFGGILFVTGFFVFIPVGIINLAIAGVKKRKGAMNNGSTFALLADYKKNIETKKEEMILGARYTF